MSTRMTQVRCLISRHPLFARRAMLWSVLLLSNLSACADMTSTSADTTAPSELLYQLSVNPHGVTMAQNATQPLTLVARNILGDTIPDFDPATVQFVSEDPTRVTVTGGILEAHGITPVDSFSGPVPLPQPTRVIASWTHAGITKADTLYVAVTATAQPVNALSLQPAPYPQDSTWSAGLGSPKQVNITALTAQHDTISGIYAFVSTDRRREHLVEYIDPRAAILNFPAIPPGKHVRVYAEANVYGVPLRDSIDYTVMDVVQLPVLLIPGVGQPQVSTGTGSVPTGYEFQAAPCAFVLFFNNSPDSVAIKFQDPTVTEGCPNAGETGNIALIEPGGGVAFRYIRPVGAHRWTITRPNGMGFTPAITGIIRIRSHTEI